MKRVLLLSLVFVLVLLVASYGAWHTGKLAPMLRSVGLDSAAQLVEITQIGLSLEKQQSTQIAQTEDGTTSQAQDNAPKSDTAVSEKDQGEIPNAMEEAVGLALKGINLVQGENGLELWRLKASWASLREEGGQIDVEMPDMVYRVGDAETPLHVTANKGNVSQHQQVLRLWEGVVCTYDEYTLRATLMTYDGKTRTMTFPEGVHVESAKTKGFAHVLTWNLDSNIIEGLNGVTISW